MTAEAVPTVREELDRKTVECLKEMVSRTESGRMPKRDLALVGRVLWSVTSGLVEDDIARMCSEAANLGTAVPMKRHFVGKGTVRTVAWFPDRTGYAVVSRNPSGEILNTNKRATEVGEREAELETLFASLRRAGYCEL